MGNLLKTLVFKSGTLLFTEVKNCICAQWMYTRKKSNIFGLISLKITMMALALVQDNSISFTFHLLNVQGSFNTPPPHVAREKEGGRLPIWWKQF